ncbi:MAG TPA: cyclic lactone autoinducer peptide [Clostridiales bacterium]|nr:cyclic lactone autoinducer peptide [Clostridiales bacterium]
MKIKLMLATLLASLATVIAATSTGACIVAGFEEPECPKCLID